jgi:hypothetical protein
VKIGPLNRRDAGWASIASAGIAAAAIVAGCASGTPQLDDLNNSPNVYPNYSSTILNVDNMPNIGMICYDGAGFATTTRDAAGAIRLVPEWDKFCASQEGKKATQHGQP